MLTHYYWAKSFDNDCQVDVAFLDFSKDFDRVSLSLVKNVMLGCVSLDFSGATASVEPVPIWTVLKNEVLLVT